MIHPVRVSNQAKYLRQHQTNVERKLWIKLRAKRFHQYKFRRQVHIGQYIVDFCCFEKKLIIELDGWIHMFRQEQDHQRDAFLCGEGFRILRFKNRRVDDAIEEVLNEIFHAVRFPSPSMGEG